LDLPAELKRRANRQAALQQARQVIEGRAKAMAAAQQADCEAKVAARQRQRESGKKSRGKEPPPPSAQPDPKAQYDFTAPASRIRKADGGQPFEQAYNAQGVVDPAMIIVGARERCAQRQAGTGAQRGGDQPGGGAGPQGGVGGQRLLQ
jgi:hypothetical protein